MTSAQTPSLFQYWDSEKIPHDIEGLFATFRDRNPDFRHWVFSESEAERFIESRYGTRERDAFRACAIPAMHSDYFSYCALLACGGIYSDADFKCLRALRPLLDGCEGGIVYLRPKLHTLKGREAMRLQNGFFVFPEPSHPFLRLTHEIATASIEARVAEKVWATGEQIPASVWLTTGAGIFSAMRFIYNWGSFDAFINGVADTPIAPFSKFICEVIGDRKRVVEACETMRFDTSESMLTWIGHPDELPTYKNNLNPSWHHVKTGLFR